MKDLGLSISQKLNNLIKNEFKNIPDAMIELSEEQSIQNDNFYDFDPVDCDEDYNDDRD